jgi:Polymerase beta, Nucleotidyltransferase
MYQHHSESIEKIKAYFEAIPDVQALLLGGSIAHGFETPSSDVDIMIIVADEDHQQRIQDGRLQFFTRELCTYPEGYVDGKYTSAHFLRQVAESGSEPARFAFAGSRLLFTRVDGIAELVADVARYPVEHKLERIRRFYAQFEAWNWYVSEALRLKNSYLLGVSVGKLILFGGRLILAHNEIIYPYHKWFLKILEQAPDKPAGLLERIHALNQEPTDVNARAYFECVRDFRTWETGAHGWPSQFMLDSELNWISGKTAVDDL